MTYCTPFLKTQTSTSDPISFGNFVFIMFCESVCAWVSLSENEFAKSLCFNKVIQTSLTQQYLVTFFVVVVQPLCIFAPLVSVPFLDQKLNFSELGFTVLQNSWLIRGG